MKLLMGTLLTVLMTFNVQAEILRATDLDSEVWKKFEKGEMETLTIEFRKSDVIPLNIKAGGELLETTDPRISYVTVKKTFFIRMSKGHILMSLDGQNYLPFNELVTGTLKAGVSSDSNGGIPHSIDIVLNAFLE